MNNIPKPDLKQCFSYMGKHTLMQNWADIQKKPILEITTVYIDGEKNIEEIYPHQKEVFYTVENEKYCVNVDTHRYYDNIYCNVTGYKNSPLKPNALINAYKKWLTDCNIGFKSVEYKLIDQT